MRSEVNPMRSIPILLDGDPGHDDAIAWMLAKASPRLEIRAVTSVSGNQTIEKTTYNALRVMALLGIDAPMAKGRPGPLVSGGRCQGYTIISFFLVDVVCFGR